MDKIAMAKIR